MVPGLDPGPWNSKVSTHVSTRFGLPGPADQKRREAGLGLPVQPQFLKFPIGVGSKQMHALFQPKAQTAGSNQSLEG